MKISSHQHQKDRKRAEKALGRPLERWQHVHHHSATQLVICDNPKYHKFLDACLEDGSIESALLRRGIYWKPAE